MVVGRQGDATQLTLSIVGYFRCDLIDRNRLEDGFHGLLGIHCYSSLGICAHLSSCSILPLLELISKVLCCFQSNNSSFLILFQFGVTSDSTCLSRFHKGVQHIFSNLCGSTHELSLDDDIRESHRLGFAQAEEIETQLQRFVGSGGDAVDSLAERGNIKILTTTVHTLVIYQHHLVSASLDGSTDVTAVGAIAGCLETHLRGNKRKTVLRSEGQLECIVVNTTAAKTARSTIINLRLIRFLVVLAYILDGALDGQRRACRPLLAGKTGAQRLGVERHVVALVQSALVQLIDNRTRDVHASGILHLTANSHIRDTYPATVIHLSRPGIDAYEQLLTFFYLYDILREYLVPCAGKYSRREYCLACYESISRIVSVAL